jgi:hypothetical protein
MLFTLSETSDDAVVKFESAMSKLQHFDVAQGYLDLLREVDALTFALLLTLWRVPDLTISGLKFGLNRKNPLWTQFRHTIDSVLLPQQPNPLSLPQKELHHI